MSGRKKKLSLKLKRYNIILIVALIVLMLLLCVLMFIQIFGSNDYYKVESREENIEKSKKSDNEDHETIGWVRVQGTNIDYPVFGVLSRDYDYPVVSTPFTWSLNDDSDWHSTMLVYGHNVFNLGPYPRIKDDSFERMEQLMGFVYYDFAQENQYMQLTMEDGKTYMYKIFSVSFMKFYDLNAYPKGEFSDAAKENYLDTVLENSIYDYDVDVSVKDDILSVITCTKFFQDGTSYDFIVTGRLVKEGEKVSQYKVHRNKNYEQIAKILKGAEDNEFTESA